MTEETLNLRILETEVVRDKSEFPKMPSAILQSYFPSYFPAWKKLFSLPDCLTTALDL